MRLYTASVNTWTHAAGRGQRMRENTYRDISLAIHVVGAALMSFLWRRDERKGQENRFCVLLASSRLRPARYARRPRGGAARPRLAPRRCRRSRRARPSALRLPRNAMRGRRPCGTPWRRRGRRPCHARAPASGRADAGTDAPGNEFGHSAGEMRNVKTRFVSHLAAAEAGLGQMRSCSRALPCYSPLGFVLASPLCPALARASGKARKPELSRKMGGPTLSPRASRLRDA